MQKQNKKFIILLAAFLFFAAVSFVAGQTGNTGTGGVGNTGTGPLGNCDTVTSVEIDGKCVVKNPAEQSLVNISDFGGLLVLAIQLALYFAGAIALLFLIIGGFQYIASRGNEETTEKAKKTISGAIIGIVIIIMSYAIISIINDLVVKGAPGP